MTAPALIAALVLGFALAADAFAASLSQGVAAGPRPHRTAFSVGAAFGAAQGLAPLLGWLAGVAFLSAIERLDHWIAFGILLLLGLNLIREGLSERRGDADPPRRARGWALAGLAVATSIDAAASGAALPALGLAPLFAASVIGGVTFAVCVGGVYAGRALGAGLGRRAELVGGLVLIAVGARILHDHGVFG